MTDTFDKFDKAQEKLGAHEIAAWLRRHPNFLQQFPDLALTLVVPREQGSAASLAGYQLEILRDKNRELSRRLQELFANAQENERLAVRTHQLTLALMKQGNAADTLRAMAASLAEDFQGDLVRIVAFHPVDGVGDVDWLQVIAQDDARLAGFRDILGSGEPVCGRLHPDKNARDSLFVMADLRLDGNEETHRIKMRNLSAGGMMGEALAAGLQRFPRG